MSPPDTFTADAPFRLVPVRVTGTLVPIAPGAAMARDAVTVVEFTTVMLLATTSAPDTFTADAPVRLVPVRVTGTLVPITPVLGAIEVSVGAGRETTVNVMVLLIPPGVVMLTLLAVSKAVPAIEKVAVTVVGLTTVTLLTVMSAPAPFTVVAPVRLLPVK